MITRRSQLYFFRLIALSLSMGVLALNLPGRSPEETSQAKIARAMAAGPDSIARNARIIDGEGDGKIVVLREGNNGWTCIPDHPGIVGHGAMCLDQPAVQWATDLLSHKPKPTNSQPGIVYMLQGGTDWSATNPGARSGTPFKEPPHWAIVWPFDPQQTGLPDQPKSTGTWIMYAGTPYAHLMINQKP